MENLQVFFRVRAYYFKLDEWATPAQWFGTLRESNAAEEDWPKAESAPKQSHRQETRDRRACAPFGMAQYPDGQVSILNPIIPFLIKTISLWSAVSLFNIIRGVPNDLNQY